MWKVSGTLLKRVPEYPLTKVRGVHIFIIPMIMVKEQYLTEYKIFKIRGKTNQGGSRGYEDKTASRPGHLKKARRAGDHKGGYNNPDSAKEQQAEGEVISVGPGKPDDSGKLVPVDLKKGNRVIFSKYSGTEVKVEGEELLIMREDDILAVIEK